MAKVLPVDFEQADSASRAIEETQSILNSGGVIAFPTDTFYGLGADPFNPDALSKVFRIKQRPPDKPLLVLIDSVTEWSTLVSELPVNAIAFMEQFWPGPLTLVFAAATGLPDMLTAGTGKIGIRIPDHPYTSMLLELLERPLTAPSANISGMEELTTAQQVEAVLGKELDLIIDGGPTPGGKPSTVLDTTTEPPTLLREGALSRDSLESVLPVQ